MRHLHGRVEEHKHKQSSICKHYMSKHGTIPKDLTENITVLRKCKGKFYCLLYEMLFIQKHSKWFPKGEIVHVVVNCSGGFSFCMNSISYKRHSNLHLHFRKTVMFLVSDSLRAKLFMWINILYIRSFNFEHWIFPVTW